MMEYLQPLNARVAIWHIGVMGDAGEQFYVSLQDVRSITLNKKGTVLADGFQRTVRTRENFFTQFQSGAKLKRQFRLEIRTPCSHHSEGHFLVFPSMELIFQTLMKRAAGWFQEYELSESEMIAKQLASVAQITRYELRTEPFYHDKSLIIGYQGYFEVKLSGTEAETRLSGMMLMLAD